MIDAGIHEGDRVVVEKRVAAVPGDIVVAIVDKLLRPATRAQAQGFVREQLVLGKTVVQLHHVNVLRAHASRFVHRRGRFLGHAKAHHFAHVLGFKSAVAVGGHGLGADAHAGVQPMLLGK